MKTQITPEIASDIIEFRREQAKDPELPTLPSIEEFADKLLELGLTRTRVSRWSILRLFSGEMYPDLVDPSTGKVYDWCTIPSAARGRRSRSTELAELRLQVAQLQRTVDALTADERRG
jgi:hypothetical protein